MLIYCAGYIINDTPYNLLIFHKNKKNFELLGGQQNAKRIILIGT
jgi:hypothetical protein